MAEEKIVFEVDVTSLAKALGDSQTQLEIYKRDMEAAIEANGRYSEQANLAAGLVAAQTKAVQQQTGAITRLTQAELALGGSINEIVKSYNAENKSVDQNRKTLNALTTEYIKADKAGREKLAPTIKNISDELKKQEGAIGDTRRNVGNYKEAFVGAFSEIAKGIPGLEGFGKAQQGVNAIMSANPIGGVVTLLTGLVQILQTNSEFADKFTFVLGGVNKAFKFTIDSVVSLFSNLSKLGEFFANPIGSIIKFGKGLSNAATEGFKAAEALDDLTEKQAEFNGQAENYRKQAEGLEKTLKDTNKTFNERKKIAGEVAELEIKAADSLIKAKQAELDAEREKTKGTQLNGEERAKLRSLELDLVGLNIDKENALKLKQTRINILLGKEETAAIKEKYKVEGDVLLKAIEDYKKFNLEREEANKKGLEENNKKRVADFQKEQEFNANKLQLDLDAVDLSVATEQEKADKKYAIQLDFLETQLKLTSEFLGADGLITKEEQQGIDAIANSIAKLKQKLANDSKNPKETLGSALGIDEKTLKEVSGRIQEVEDVVNGVQDLINTVSQERINTIENERNAEIQAVNDSVGSEEEKAKKIKEINAKANKEKYEAEKAAFEANKATSIILAIINTAQAVIAQFSNPTPYVGIVLAALAAATGAAQIAVIASQSPPPPPAKFATGVIGLDGDGTETSDSIDARLSKGESVLTAKATRKYHRQLAYMEMSVGNKPNYQFGGGMFAGGFIPSVSGDGGFLARETIKQSDSALMMSEAIRNGFLNAPAPVLSIVELNTKQRDINRSVNLSEA